MADLRRKARKKPWIDSKQGRNRRKESGELVRPYDNKTHTGISITLYSDSRWKATREAVLYRDGLCQWCLHLAKVTEATEVDHIIPANKCEAYDVSPFDQTNLVTSCRSCNSRRASYEAKGIFYETFDEWVTFLRKKITDKFNDK